MLGYIFMTRARCACADGLPRDHIHAQTLGLFRHFASPHDDGSEVGQSLQQQGDHEAIWG